MIITEEEVIAAARADPRELNALIAAGQPDAIIALSRAFEEAGRTSHDAYQRGRQSHGLIATSYTNDDAPVLDAAAQDGQANRNLGNAGQDLEDAAVLLKRAVTALDGAQQTGQRALSGMQAGLHDLLARWNRFVLANAATGTVTPADRQRALAEGVGIVDTAAGTIRNAIDEYDAGLRRDAAELRGRGYTEDPANLATHVAQVPDPAGPGVVGDVVETLERNKDVLAALGVPPGVVAAALALKKGVGLFGRTSALAKYVQYASRTATDPARALLDDRLAQRALQRFKEGFPKTGAHAQRGAIGTALRGLQESRVARLAGKAFLPLTAVSGIADVVTGGGYDGARGAATRAFGAAGALGAGALLLGVANPVGITVAGAAVLGYGAWTLGNMIYDNRAEIAESFNAAKDWAGERLSDAGDYVADKGKKLLSSVSFGLL